MLQREINEYVNEVSNRKVENLELCDKLKQKENEKINLNF